MINDSEQKSTVFIVDDDQAIRHAMELLMQSVGVDYEIYHSADDFLAAFSPEKAGCLVLDIRMPGLGGLELPDKLIEMRSSLPIIFITDDGDVPMAVEAMQKGAVGFIQKPFRDRELLDRIGEALKTDQEHRTEREGTSTPKSKTASISSPNGSTRFSTSSSPENRTK